MVFKEGHCPVRVSRTASLVLTVGVHLLAVLPAYGEGNAPPPPESPPLGHAEASEDGKDEVAALRPQPWRLRQPEALSLSYAQADAPPQRAGRSAPTDVRAAGLTQPSELRPAGAQRRLVPVPSRGRPPEPRDTRAAELNQPSGLFSAGTTRDPLPSVRSEAAGRGPQSERTDRVPARKASAEPASLSQPSLVRSATLPAPSSHAESEPREFSQPARLLPSQVAPTPAGRISAMAVLAQADKVAAEASTAQQFTQVIALCREALARDSGDSGARHASRLGAWAHNRRGLIANQAGDTAAAVDDFEAAIALNPQSWRAVHNRGVVRVARHAYELALKDFDRAIELKPRSAVAHRNRAEVLLELGAAKAATRSYTKAIELDPEWAELWLARARAHHRLGNSRLAVQDFNQSLRIDAQNPATYVDRGRLYEDLGYPAQSLKDYRAAMLLDPTYAAAYQAAAWLMATCSSDRLRRADKAVSAARRAMVLRGEDDPLYLDTMAAALALANRFEAAVEMQQRAIRLATRRGVDTADLHTRLALYERSRPYQAQPPLQR